MAPRDIYERTFDEDIATENGSTAGCPECGGTVHTNTSETACTDCGLVIEERPIDHGPEWRSFEDQPDDPERTGPPLTPTRHDRGLSSEIGYDSTDANGTVIPGRKRRQLGRLRREQTRGRWASKVEQNLGHGLAEVRRIVSVLELSESLRDRACALYRTAAGEDLIRGRSIEAMAAASVYAACRCTGFHERSPRSMRLHRCRMLGSAMPMGFSIRNWTCQPSPWLPPSTCLDSSQPLISLWQPASGLSTSPDGPARAVSTTGVGRRASRRPVSTGLLGSTTSGSPRPRSVSSPTCRR
jgi:hypothetical protein